jgi:hypothetical protein
MIITLTLERKKSRVVEHTYVPTWYVDWLVLCSANAKDRGFESRQGVRGI